MDVERARRLHLREAGVAHDQHADEQEDHRDDVLHGWPRAGWLGRGLVSAAAIGCDARRGVQAGGKAYLEHPRAKVADEVQHALGPGVGVPRCERTTSDGQSVQAGQTRTL